mgnify:CR=1 FL=1
MNRAYKAAIDIGSNSILLLIVDGEKNEVKFESRITSLGKNLDKTKKFEEINVVDLEKTFRTNLFAPFRLIQELLPFLKKAQSPHVVNIGSVGGVQGSLKFTGLSSYSASKASLAILTECLAEEYKDSHIKFNCLSLGAVQTEMLKKAFPDYKAPITPIKMAEFISSFSLESHEYLNGKVISISQSNP